MGNEYVAETTAGTIRFGEHLWKLSDQKYLIRPTSRCVFRKMTLRWLICPVTITDDGIVQF